jgi:hypothetical protein
MTAFAKMISRFDPTLRHGLAEGERHYTMVHFPFAQGLLASMPQVRSYHINRVICQLDLAGTWHQRPTAWRFVILTFDPSRGLEFDSATNNMIARDHLNFLCRLRSTVVTERVTINRLSGQTALRKYLIEVDRADEARADCTAVVEEIEAAVSEQAAGQFGMRLVRCNRVTAELAAETLEEEGQKATDRVLPATDKLAYIEVYADDDRWGNEFFAAPRLQSTLVKTPLRVCTYAIEERCGLDRRNS